MLLSALHSIRLEMLLFYKHTSKKMLQGLTFDQCTNIRSLQITNLRLALQNLKLFETNLAVAIFPEVHKEFEFIRINDLLS